MKKNRENKKPSQVQKPENKKKARGKEKGRNPENLSCVWDTSCVDCEGAWSWTEVDPRLWWDHICPARENFCSMKWGEITGNGNHPIDVDNIIPAAQRRLEEIGQGDTDVLYSLRIGGRRRIWGIRELNTFRVLWWDPNHEIYPVNLRNT